MLVGDKLENLLGHFVDSYNNTLTHLYFILDDSEEDGELELNDQFRQLSSVLVDTVSQCPKITHLKYNIPLFFTYNLMIYILFYAIVHIGTLFDK
jgi:hypothetical protein